MCSPSPRPDRRRKAWRRRNPPEAVGRKAPGRGPESPPRASRRPPRAPPRSPESPPRARRRPPLAPPRSPESPHRARRRRAAVLGSAPRAGGAPRVGGAPRARSGAAPRGGPSISPPLPASGRPCFSPAPSEFLPSACPTSTASPPNLAGPASPSPTPAAPSSPISARSMAPTRRPKNCRKPLSTPCCRSRTAASTTISASTCGDSRAPPSSTSSPGGSCRAAPP